MARLDGKVALITGAGTGIGRATARAMAAEGAKVVVAEINAEAGEQTAQIVAQAGGDCIAVATDVTQEDSVRAAIDAAVRHYGGLHILHNNAGGSTPVDSTVVEVPIEEFWRAIRLDLFGTFLGCRFGIPAIIASGGGSVINMASNVALMGVAGRDCYTAAKGGIAAITRQRPVFDRNLLECVLGGIAVARQHHRNRLADVTHPVYGEAPLLHCGLDGDGERSRPAAGILAGNDAIDPRHSERAGDIHGQDLGMGMRRAQDRRMQCVRPNREIVAKAPVASQQISVFEAADRTPGIGGLVRPAAPVHGAARRRRRPGRHFPRNSGLRFW
jgi:hypothetical protein